MKNVRSRTRTHITDEYWEGCMGSVTTEIKPDIDYSRKINLMMEAVSTFETPVNFYQTTRRNIPEDSHLRSILLYS
jgi:hypothetical protein